MSVTLELEGQREAYSVVLLASQSSRNGKLQVQQETLSQNIGGEQYGETPDANLWPPYGHEFLHVYMHGHTHKHAYIKSINYHESLLHKTVSELRTSKPLRFELKTKQNKTGVSF